MAFSLIPRQQAFFDLFDEAASNVVVGAELLKEMMENFDRRVEIGARIEETEHEGDITTHEIVERLNRTFVTPIDSEDIRELASALDDIIDFIEATSDRMLLYETSPPSPDVVQLSRTLLGATQELSKAVRRLRDLKKARRILDHCIEVNRLENEGDRASRRALAAIFKGADPMEALKWKEIVEHLETAIDKCEDAANVIESVVVRYA